MSKTFIVTGPNTEGRYLAICNEDPVFTYESDTAYGALNGLIWVMTDNSPKEDDHVD